MELDYPTLDAEVPLQIRDLGGGLVARDAVKGRASYVCASVTG